MNKKYQQKNMTWRSEKGAASIFVVIFFSLLLGVITVSFVRIVNQDQQQALNNDLSQSAYDAAKAGVADANRAVALCNSQSEPDKTNCLAQFTNNCNDISGFSTEFGDLKIEKLSDTEVRVGSSPEDSTLNQSYTCAKVQYETPDITLSLSNQKMRVIELSSDQPFSFLEVQWFNSGDAEANPGTDLQFPSPGFPKLATDSASWGGQTAPPLLRLQLLQSNSDGSFNLTNLNNSSKTTFLYPVSGMTPVQSSLSRNALTIDSRGTTKPLQPSRALCSNAKFISSQLACQAGLNIPAVASGQKTYLIVEPIYNNATVQISLLQGEGGPVSLAKGYPTIDVTGKAGDLFRRIKTTVDVNSNPNSSIGGDESPGYDSTKTLCKNFSVGREYYASTAAQCNN